MDTEPSNTPERDFTAELDHYIVLKLVLAEYRGTRREMPQGFTLCSVAERARVARTEKRLLQTYFSDWKAPLRGRLEGWRPDSPVFALHHGKLVGGVYLVDASAFDPDPRWGELHYAFMDPAYRGCGVYSAIYAAAVARALSWGLEGLYLNSDRHMLPEVNERWGAVRWRTFEKRVEPKRRKTVGERIERSFVRLRRQLARVAGRTPPGA